MKKFGLAILVACIGLFAACSDDDKTPNDNATAVAGTYKSDLVITLPLTPPIDDEKDFTVTRTGDNLVTLELKSFKFLTIDVGDIAVKDVPVTKTSGGYAFTETTRKITPTDLGLEVKVTVNGTVVGNKIIIDLVIDEVEGFDAPILVDIEGTKSGQKSTMANITAMTFAGDFVLAQPTIESHKTELVVYINDAATEAQLKEMVVTVAVSDKATVDPASGSKVDLSSGSAKFTVTAEDGVTKKEYTVKTGKQNVSFYDFNEWVTSGVGKATHKLTKSPDWSSSNSILATAVFLGKVPRVTVSEAEGHEGSAALIESVESLKPSQIGSNIVPKLTPGSIFTGIFNLDSNNSLGSTRFGVVFTKKPLKLKGYYKYKAGAETNYYITADITKPHLAEKSATPIKDKFAISAVLYEYDPVLAKADEEWNADPANSNASKKKYTTYLTGINIKSSEKIVATLMLSGDDAASFTKFEQAFNYVATYDPAKSYRLAIIASSSADGDKFNGAVDSQLLIDNIEIIAE